MSDKKTDDLGLGSSMTNDLEKKLDELSTKETANLVKSFQEHFEECTKACKKPNILVAGITGAGKSSLINSVFGEELAESGAGMPVTQHFQKFQPESKPIVIYDSKGLEWQEHKKFIEETGSFFTKLQKSKEVSEHIHCIWYVVNCGRGRIEDFEIELVRKIFTNTPVLFILNKTDLSDSKTIKTVKKIIEDEKLENNKGIHICISDRKTYTQTWCPECLSDDIIYDEDTKELECSECGYTKKLESSYGMEKLIKHTCDLLPELAKDAFMFSQTASISEKNSRAKDVVKETLNNVSLDTSGSFIKVVAEMCAKLFVIWGWPLTADTFKESLATLQKDYMDKLKFQERLFAASIDKLLGGKLSKSFSGFIGFTMNRGMKKLNQQLISECSKGSVKDMKVDEFFQEADLDEQIVSMFFEFSMGLGPDVAIDRLWDLTLEELIELRKHIDITGDTEDSGLFGNIKIDEDKLKEFQEKLGEGGNISIKEFDVDEEKKEEKKDEKKNQEKKEEKKEDYTPSNEDLDLD